LLAKKARTEAKDYKGNTPLHWAVHQGKLDVIKKLIENKANVNAKNNKGNTPLHFAALKGKLDIVKYLIKKEASVNAINYNWFSPIDSAKDKKTKNFLKKHGAKKKMLSEFLLEKLIPDSIILGFAIQNNNINTVKHLVSNYKKKRKKIKNIKIVIEVSPKNNKLPTTDLYIEAVKAQCNINIVKDQQIFNKEKTLRYFFANKKADPLLRELIQLRKLTQGFYALITPYKLAELLGHSKIATYLKKQMDRE